MAKPKEKHQAPGMTLEEARAYRKSLYKPSAVSHTPEEVREMFRIFWAQNKAKYGKSKELETVLWVHLKSIKMDTPKKFEDGIAHFGLKKKN